MSYITKKLATDITKNEIFRKSTTTCICKPATTSTAVGCFVTSNCITLTCKLLDHRATTDDIQIQISFRIVETLGENDIIIGLSDIRKHDLTKKFRHIYVDDIEASPNYDHPTIDAQGEDAEALNFNQPQDESQRVNEVKSDDTTSYRNIKTSRRVIMPPQLQKEIITRAGKRSNIPCLPGMKKRSIFDDKIDRSSRFFHEQARRSKRLNKVVVNDIHSQRKEESRTSDAKSLEDLLQLHMSEIKEGHTFKKTDLLDSEERKK